MKNDIESKTRNILVIDDDENICKLISKTLIPTKHYVETFTNSLDAIDKFNEYPFDLVITDLQMPELSGWHVIKRVKEKNSSIPVILITGSLGRYGEKSLTNFGADFIINKPFNPKKLLEIVNEILK